MVEDPQGGVILVGGKSYWEDSSYKLFRLPQLGARWVEMPQKLAVGRYFHIAVLVSSTFANCSYV